MRTVRKPFKGIVLTFTGVDNKACRRSDGGSVLMKVALPG